MRGRLLGLVCVGLAGTTAGCGGAESRHHVVLPTVTASPTRVVAAYVAAINSHDIPTARALLTPAYLKLTEAAPDSWFTNAESITHLHLDKPFDDRYTARSLHYRYGVSIGAEFVLKQRQVYSMSNGKATWGFTLVRNSRNRRWRIGEEGTG